MSPLWENKSPGSRWGIAWSPLTPLPAITVSSACAASKISVKICFSTMALTPNSFVCRPVSWTRIRTSSRQISIIDAALVEPLACALRGLDESGVRPADAVAVIGLGPIGLMFVRLAKSAFGARVIAIARRIEQIDRAISLGADEGVLLNDPKEAATQIRQHTAGRGADIVIEAVGRPEIWELALDFVRKGGTVNFFGGCPSGTKISMDTSLLHYSEITCKATFHHTPAHIRRALDLIARGEATAAHFVNAEEPLTALPRVLHDLAHASNHRIKTAIIP